MIILSLALPTLSLIGCDTVGSDNGGGSSASQADLDALQAQLDALQARLDAYEAEGHLTSDDLAGLATEDFVAAAISAVDHSAYALAEDLAGTQADLAAAQADIDAIQADYLTGSDLSDYALAADLTAARDDITAIQTDYLTSRDLTGYATESWVEKQATPPAMPPICWPTSP